VGPVACSAGPARCRCRCTTSTHDMTSTRTSRSRNRCAGSWPPNPPLLLVLSPPALNSLGIAHCAVDEAVWAAARKEPLLHATAAVLPPAAGAARAAKMMLRLKQECSLAMPDAPSELHSSRDSNRQARRPPQTLTS
jgi:hypothetical protein